MKIKQLKALLLEVLNMRLDMEKMLKNIILISCMVLTNSTFAAEDTNILEFETLETQKTVCTHGSQARKIEVVYLSDAKLPCEVHYTKDLGMSILWSARNTEGYCETKAAEFVEKQKAWGWSCS